MTHLEYLKDRMEETETALRKAQQDHQTAKRRILVELGFKCASVPGSFLNADVWEFGEDVFPDSDRALEFAEERGMI